MTPESIAKELGLEYIGKNTLLEDCPECKGNYMVVWFDYYEGDGGSEPCENCCLDENSDDYYKKDKKQWGKVNVTLYQFNVPDCNHTTVGVYELSELKSKVEKSRKKFKVEV